MIQILLLMTVHGYQVTYVPNDGFEMVIESLGLGDSLINDSVYTHLISQVNFF